MEVLGSMGLLGPKAIKVPRGLKADEGDKVPWDHLVHKERKERLEVRGNPGLMDDQATRAIW